MAHERRAATEEPEAELLRELYAQFGATILGFARGWVHDPARAEDVLQETMLRAWRRPQALAGDQQSQLAYLLTLARNVIIDGWRREQRRPRLADDDEGLHTAGVDHEADRVLDEWLIEEAVRRLSPDHRAVIQELYFNERSVDEAAAVLRIPAGTVKSRGYYAVRALRAVFEEMGVSR